MEVLDVIQGAFQEIFEMYIIENKNKFYNMCVSYQIVKTPKKNVFQIKQIIIKEV